jgi:hypothetical protein
MADIKLDLNISALSQYLENFAQEIAKDVEKSVKGLAISTHAHILEEAKKKLNKFDLPIYQEDLSQAKQLDKFLWEIELINRGAKIEQGREPRDMKPALLKDGKTSADGTKYRVIPMTQGKESKSTNPKTLDKSEELIGNIKSFLKTNHPKLSYSGIEKDSSGSPRVSRIDPITGHPKPLHSFDIPSKIPSKKGNTPQLYGLNIYQVPNKNGKIQKIMTTFRTVTDGEDQKDKWIYPARGAVNIFQETKDWATDQWSNIWIPQILQKYQGK